MYLSLKDTNVIIQFSGVLLCDVVSVSYSIVPHLQDYDPYEENPGTGPFSEPETQIMRKLALTFDPHIWVNVHSGMEVSGPK